MQGAKALVADERGVFCLLLVVTATILAALSIITGADWLSFMKYLVVTFVASKTTTGAIESWARRAIGTPPPAPNA